MKSIRWYGPTLVLVTTVLVVMIAGPGLARRLAWQYTDEKIQLVGQQLQESQMLVELNRAFRKVAVRVEPSVVHLEVSSRRLPRGGVGQDPADWFRLPPNHPDLTPKQDGDSDQNDQDDQSDPSGPSGSSDPGDDGISDTPPTEPDTNGFRDYDVPELYGSGSGWVYDDQGHIITNLHVVVGAELIRVRFSDGAERRAAFVGADEKTDIAVLKVAADNLHPADRAAEPVAQGDIVFAFGSPFKFEFSMSQGIVSAVNRHNLGILNRKGGYENFIQTDAAINPGNSGGPLTNIQGQVVGMNTAIAASRNPAQLGEASFSGLGFAIPVEMVQNVADQIIQNGKVRRGYLGIYITDLEPKMAQTFGYTGRGVLVEQPTPDGAADKAGVLRGDIVTHINDRAIQTADELRGIVAHQAPGSNIELKVFRNGQSQTLSFKIDELPEGNPLANLRSRLPLADVPTDVASQTLRMLGIETVSINTVELAQRADMTFTPGVIVRAIRRRSVAESVGLYPEQVITDVMGKPVSNTEELTAALESYDLKKGVRVSVMIDGLPRYIVLALPEERPPDGT